MGGQFFFSKIFWWVKEGVEEGDLFFRHWKSKDVEREKVEEIILKEQKQTVKSASWRKWSVVLKRWDILGEVAVWWQLSCGIRSGFLKLWLNFFHFWVMILGVIVEPNIWVGETLGLNTYGKLACRNK